MPEPIPTAEEFGRRMTTQQRGSIPFETQADVTAAVQSLIDAVRLDEQRKALVDAANEISQMINHARSNGVLVAVAYHLECLGRLQQLIAKLDAEVQDGG